MKLRLQQAFWYCWYWNTLIEPSSVDLVMSGDHVRCHLYFGNMKIDVCFYIIGTEIYEVRDQEFNERETWPPLVAMRFIFFILVFVCTVRCRSYHSADIFNTERDGWTDQTKAAATSSVSVISKDGKLLIVNGSVTPSVATATFKDGFNATGYVHVYQRERAQAVAKCVGISRVWCLVIIGTNAYIMHKDW